VNDKKICRISYYIMRKKVRCYRCNTLLQGQPARITSPSGRESKLIGTIWAELDIEIFCPKCGWVWFGEAWMWQLNAHQIWFRETGWKFAKPLCSCPSHLKYWVENKVSSDEAISFLRTLFGEDRNGAA